MHTGEASCATTTWPGSPCISRRGSWREAGPGEVLASSTVKDLVVGSGLRFADRGAHALKGVEDEWRLFAVQR